MGWYQLISSSNGNQDDLQIIYESPNKWTNVLEYRNLQKSLNVIKSLYDAVIISEILIKDTRYLALGGEDGVYLVTSKCDLYLHLSLSRLVQCRVHINRLYYHFYWVLTVCQWVTITWVTSHPGQFTSNVYKADCVKLKNPFGILHEYSWAMISLGNIGSSGILKSITFEEMNDMSFFNKQYHIT